MFLALFLSGNAPSIWRLRSIEASQELLLRVLQDIPIIGPCRFYFIQTEAALNDHFRMLAHWILFRDILYKRIDVQKHLDTFLTTFGDLVYAGQFQLHHFLDTMVHTRQCNIDNFYDRGSFRMRYIAVGLLSLAIRTSNDPDYCPLAGPLFTITCMFSIITGGLTVCHEIRRRLLELPPSEP